MKALTIGGATQDIYLHHGQADHMSLTLNGCLSEFILLGNGTKIEIDQPEYHAGGGSTNSAVAFKKLDYDVDCVATVGDDFYGKNLLVDLERYEISRDHIHIKKNFATGVSYIIGSQGKDQTIFVYRGANTGLTVHDIPLSQCAGYDLIYITSLSNQAAHLLPHIAQQARQANKPIAINPGKSQLTEGAAILKQSLPFIDILIMNEEETKAFMTTLIAKDDLIKRILSCPDQQCYFGEKMATPYLIETSLIYDNMHFSIKKFFSMVLELGPRIVVITNGKNGVYVASRAGGLFHPSLQVKVVDTVGAGDAFGSCFSASIYSGHSIEDSLRYGIVNSASVIENIGAKPGLLSYDQLEKRARVLDRNILHRFDLDHQDMR